nr:mechanosensitive ion channel family protein [Lachnospiraceae bacterium]
EKIQKDIMKEMKANNKIIESPDNTVVVDEIFSSHSKLLAKMWVKTEDYWPVYYAMEQNIKNIVKLEEESEGKKNV